LESIEGAAGLAVAVIYPSHAEGELMRSSVHFAAFNPADRPSIAITRNQFDLGLYLKT
jgi:hypothetical protein